MMFKENDIVRIAGKSRGKQFSFGQLRDRFGNDLLGEVKRVEGDEVIVVVINSTNYEGEDYRFHRSDLLLVSRADCCEVEINNQEEINMDKYGLVKLTAWQKIKLSAGDKAKIQAGFVDACTMGVTDKGRAALEAILLDVYDEKMTAAANEAIAEAKEDYEE